MVISLFYFQTDSADLDELLSKSDFNLYSFTVNSTFLKSEIKCCQICERKWFTLQNFVTRLLELEKKLFLVHVSHISHLKIM